MNETKADAAAEEAKRVEEKRREQEGKTFRQKGTEVKK